MGSSESKVATNEPASAGASSAVTKSARGGVSKENANDATKGPMYRPKVANSIVDIIGATPMVRVIKSAKENGCQADIILKLESMEPCNSVKDRLGRGLIEFAEARGEIRPGESIIVESTSGNTGIGLFDIL